MNCQDVIRQLLQRSRIGLPVFVALAILVPGCAGKRIDMLTSLNPFSDDESTPVADGEEAGADDDSQLVADAADETNAQLSAYSAEDIIEGPPTLSKRFRSLFGRSEKAVVTTDPFLVSDSGEKPKPDPEPKQPVADNDGPTVEELLASFEANVAEEPAESGDWWKSRQESDKVTQTEFSVESTADFDQEFDTRLERLRAELAGRVSPRTAENPMPVAPLESQSAQLTDQTPVRQEAQERSLFSEPAVEDTARDSRHPLVDVADESVNPQRDTKARIKAMLADARRDWENWNLRRAYRTALDAQELAVLEGIAFEADEENPQMLAAKIASELRNESQFGLKMSETGSATSDTVNPFSDGSSFAVDGSASDEARHDSWFGFPELSDATNPWTSRSGGIETGHPSSAEYPAEARTTARSSGVSLLPPDDDFPSDAAQGEWQRSASAAPTDEADGTDRIQLTMHRTPEFTLRRHENRRQRFPGLTSEDRKALQNTAAAQRNRVLDSETAQFPELPSPFRADAETQQTIEPIRVAQAPRFALDRDLAASSDSIDQKSGSPPNTSLLSQVWQSQPIWLIAGIVLLIIALRMSPWPRQNQS